MAKGKKNKRNDVEAVDAGDAVTELHTPLLDTEALRAEAQARFDAMSANPEHKGAVEETYSAFVIGLLGGLDQAVSDALNSESEVRLANIDRLGIGPIARKHTLAAKVAAGVYNVVDPVPVPDPIPDPVPDPEPVPDPIPDPVPDPEPVPDPIPDPVPDPEPVPEEDPNLP
jgi:hypothetical protein